MLTPKRLEAEVLVGLAKDTPVYLSRRGEALKVDTLTFTICASDSSWHPGLPGRPLDGIVEVGLLYRRQLRKELSREREFFIDNLVVRIHFIIVMIRWTGLAPWEFEFPFPGSLTSTFLRKELSMSHT